MNVSSWFVVLALTEFTITFARGEFFILSGAPEYNTKHALNANESVKDVYCITDEVDSALTWNSNLQWIDPKFVDLNSVDKPFVLHNNNIVYPNNSNFTCQMSNKISCSKSWTRMGNWNYVTSLTKPMSPVSDNRWEDFKEEKMSEKFRAITVLSSNGSFSVSIRGTTDAHFALCNEDNTSSFCFYIILGGWKNTKSVIRKCENGVPELASKIPSGDCLKAMASIKSAILSSKEWKTFVIKWNFDTEIGLSVYESNTRLLHYSKPKKLNYFSGNRRKPSENPKYFLFARSQVQMLMKFHIYDYLLTATTQSKLISPEAMPLDRNVCIEMSISLCKKCFMTVDLIDHNGKRKAVETFQKKVTNTSHDLPVWQNVKINTTLSEGMQLPIKMELNTLLGNTLIKNNSYWAVSNIRRCYDGALKVVKIKAHQDYNVSSYFWPVITCQKLSTTGISTIIESKNLKKSSSNAVARSLCSEGKTGPSCSVNCSKLFAKNENCQDLSVCDNQGCSCAQGFTMSTMCNKRCPDSKYGFECLQTCGNCADEVCSFSTGKCKYGCLITENTLFIPPYCKTRIESPPAPGVDLINSTCVRVYLEVKKEYKIIPISIGFEIQKNSTAPPTFISEPVFVKRSTVSIQTHIDGLSPGTTYKLSGVIRANNRTLRGQWINFTTPCTESVALNFIATSNKSSLTLYNLVDVHLNDSCPYTWYRVQLFSENGKLFDDSTAFPKTFTDLEPFTHYKIIVSSEKAVILNKIISTLEGAPSPVRNVHVSYSSTDEIVIKWSRPEKARGKIVNYTTEIQLVQSRGCNDLSGLSHKSTYNNITEQYHRKYALTNTAENSFSYLFKGLKPYSVYNISVYACTSRYQGEKVEVLRETAFIDIPTEVFQNLRFTNEGSSTVIAGYLRWDPPEDCASITGPIRACKLLFKEIDSRFTIENDYYYPIEKSMFDGAETYEVKLYPLRDVYRPENKTVYSALNFTLPARAPPSVRNAETVEVDILNKTTTLRWDPPAARHHGQLDHYSIAYCNNVTVCNDGPLINVSLDATCRFNKFVGVPCKTIPLPPDEYDEFQIRAHNVNVTETSEAVSVRIRRTEFVPDAPENLTLNVLSKENSTIAVDWSQPLNTGGRLRKFIIEASVESSRLKSYPWHNTFREYNVLDYRMRYSVNIDLFPSTAFIIKVRAVTVGGLIGNTTQGIIILPVFVKFSTEELRSRINDDLTVSVTVPQVLHDIKDSALIIVVEGPKYCDRGSGDNANVKSLFISENSSYYKVAWKAAVIRNPDLYANKEFLVGNGIERDNIKNYAMCSKESYIIHMILCQLNEKINHRFNIKKSECSLLKSIKTNAIFLEKMPKNLLATWLTPLLLILLLFTLLLVLIIYRKKFINTFARNKIEVGQQENMPLTNDIINNKNNNLMMKTEKGIFLNDNKDSVHNNILTIDNKQEFIVPGKLEDFEKYFEIAYKSGSLTKDYLSIKSGAIYPCTYGARAEMKSKNRYANLFPYDDTRVILKKLSDDPYSDYINASYITGYGGNEKTYIATQGPKSNTVNDFWRMAYQENVRIICMMTNTVENGKVKCEQYWPSAIGQKLLYGDIFVEFSSEEVYSDYTYRTFQISRENQETRLIKHLHYTAWPDHGVPSTPKSIVTFLKEIENHWPVPRDPHDPPIIVHCSAGIGRTGTLIVLDMSICQAFAENMIDVHAHVSSAREQRLNMVDNAEQYLLVHLVLVEYLNSKSTCFACNAHLPERISKAKKNYSNQYQRILDTSWWNEILDSPSLTENSLSNKNRAKHRFAEPADSLNRLYLKRSTRSDEARDYIAAVNVKGIIGNFQYVTTQLPMPSTFADFWRMLSEENIKLVLVLELPDLQDPTYCEVVPENQAFGNTKYIKVLRQEKSTVDSKYYFNEEVLIIDSSEPTKEQFVKIISYKNWPVSSLPSPIELVNLWKVVEELRQRQKCPLVTVCRDGITASGIWLALSFLLNKMSIDRECDVTEAARVIMKYRSEFINKPEHFEYLYDIALAWWASQDSNK